MLFFAVDTEHKLVLFEMYSHVIPDRFCEGVCIGHNLSRFSAHIDAFIIGEGKGISRHNYAKL